MRIEENAAAMRHFFVVWNFEQIHTSTCIKPLNRDMGKRRKTYE